MPRTDPGSCAGCGPARRSLPPAAFYSSWPPIFAPSPYSQCNAPQPEYDPDVIWDKYVRSLCRRVAARRCHTAGSATIFHSRHRHRFHPRPHCASRSYRQQLRHRREPDYRRQRPGFLRHPVSHPWEVFRQSFRPRIRRHIHDRGRSTSAPPSAPISPWTLAKSKPPSKSPPPSPCSTQKPPPSVR